MRIGLIPSEGVAAVLHGGSRKWWDLDVPVDITVYGSTREQEQALESGETDIVFMNALSAMILRSQGLPLVALTTFSRVRKDILASPKSDAMGLADLTEVAVSHGTTIEYYTDLLLQLEGMDPRAVRKVEIASMEGRLDALIDGEVGAAMLPSPLAHVAVQRGARILATNLVLDPAPREAYLVAREAWLVDHEDEVRAILPYLQRSIDELNADAPTYREAVAQAMGEHAADLPEFELTPIPDLAPCPETTHAAFESWLTERGLLRRPVSYTELVAPIGVGAPM